MMKSEKGKEGSRERVGQDYIPRTLYASYLLSSDSMPGK